MKPGRLGNELRNTWLRLSAAGVLVASLIAIPSGSAQAVETVRLSEEQKIELIVDLRRQGASEAEITRRTGYRLAQSTSTAPSLLSINTDVTVPNPHVYYDSVNEKYVAYADYNWNDYRTLGDGHFSTSDVGGNDVLSIRFSQDVVQTSTPSGSIYWGGWRGLSSSTPLPPDGGAPLFPGLWENSEDGALIQWKDETKALKCGGADFPNCARYNSQSGTLSYAFKRPPGCLQIFAQYAHTWNDTRITSAGVSNSGFEIGFSSAEHRWQATSGATQLGC